MLANLIISYHPLMGWLFGFAVGLCWTHVLQIDALCSGERQVVCGPVEADCAMPERTGLFWRSSSGLRGAEGGGRHHPVRWISIFIQFWQRKTNRKLNIDESFHNSRPSLTFLTCLRITKVSNWDEWDVCSTTCGPGQKIRSRTGDNQHQHSIVLEL